MKGYLLYVYICFAIGDPIIKRGMVEISLTGLTLPYFFACPKPGPVFPASYIVVFVYVQ
jgi:hypothetical protein